MKKKRYIVPETESTTVYIERLMEGGSVHGTEGPNYGVKNGGESDENDEAAAKGYNDYSAHNDYNSPWAIWDE